MDIIAVIDELHAAYKRLDNAGGPLFKLACEKAENERLYRQALAHEIMRLREEGMPATLISDVARGNKADERHMRDLAEIKYKSACELLRSIETQISALQTIIKYRSDV